MKALPSLDAHAHLDHAHTMGELAESGAVLAMTFSLEEAAFVVGKCDPIVVWVVGCHPRKLRAQESFDAKRFRDLAEGTAVVGEIGWDTGAHYRHASLETQLQTFRAALEIVADLPRARSREGVRRLA